MKAALHAVGEFQSRLVLTVIYILVLPLFALIARSGDPLQLRGGPAWRLRRAPDRDLEAGRRQS